jgi:hypothetical protein
MTLNRHINGLLALFKSLTVDGRLTFSKIENQQLVKILWRTSLMGPYTDLWLRPLPRNVSWRFHARQIFHFLEAQWAEL